jgi:hypothetical protein
MTVACSMASFGFCAPAPWRDLPETHGPRTTCYNRFVRWRQAGVWDRIMDALAAGHNAAVQMIDTSVVRVHQHGACVADNNHQDMGRSRAAWPARFTLSWTPTACRSVSLLRPAKRMTTGYVRLYSAPCCPKRCCWRIAVTTPIGSGSLFAARAHGRTFRRNEIAKIRSASARIYIVHATWSSASSTRSSSVGVSRPDTTNSQLTIWRSSNSHQSEFGCVLMSPRPSLPVVCA